MRGAIFAILFLLLCYNAYARDYSALEVVDAIFIAEGGAKAHYLYGIRSVHYKDLAEAQRICFRTVRHAQKDWTRQGKKGDFIQFLGNRYCPTKGMLSKAERKVNGNWVKNVRWFIEHHNK